MSKEHTIEIEVEQTERGFLTESAVGTAVRRYVIHRIKGIVPDEYLSDIVTVLRDTAAFIVDVADDLSAE